MPINFFLPQVTRIPITGPEPFNTLVCVQAITTGGSKQVTTGNLDRWATTVPTSFRLAGFDQRVPPIFQHSTTAYLSTIGPAEDGGWTYAVDEVTGAGFSPYDGSYYVNLNVALQPSDPVPDQCFSFGGPYGICLYWMWIQVTSFVLCYEPPPPPQPSSHRRSVRSEVAAGMHIERLGPGAGLAERMAQLAGASHVVPTPQPGNMATSDTHGPHGKGCRCRPK